MSDNFFATSPSTDSPKLLDRVRAKLRFKHYSIRTETAYSGWIRRFIRFHGRRHPGEMGKREVEAFLTSLAVERKVSASTQNQALSALLFLYREIPIKELKRSPSHRYFVDAYFADTKALQTDLIWSFRLTG